MGSIRGSRESLSSDWSPAASSKPLDPPPPYTRIARGHTQGLHGEERVNSHRGSCQQPPRPPSAGPPPPTSGVVTKKGPGSNRCVASRRRAKGRAPASRQTPKVAVCVPPGSSRSGRHFFIYNVGPYFLEDSCVLIFGPAVCHQVAIFKSVVIPKDLHKSNGPTQNSLHCSHFRNLSSILGPPFPLINRGAYFCQSAGRKIGQQPG